MCQSWKSGSNDHFLICLRTLLIPSSCIHKPAVIWMDDGVVHFFLFFFSSNLNSFKQSFDLDPNFPRQLRSIISVRFKFFFPNSLHRHLCYTWGKRKPVALAVKLGSLSLHRVLLFLDAKPVKHSICLFLVKCTSWSDTSSSSYWLSHLMVCFNNMVATRRKLTIILSYFVIQMHCPNSHIASCWAKFVSAMVKASWWWWNRNSEEKF